MVEYASLSSHHILFSGNPPVGFFFILASHLSSFRDLIGIHFYLLPHIDKELTLPNFPYTGVGTVGSNIPAGLFQDVLWTPYCFWLPLLFSDPLLH
jgi:hypothetical protein